jgi:hypothetical protein
MAFRSGLATAGEWYLVNDHIPFARRDGVEWAIGTLSDSSQVRGLGSLFLLPGIPSWARSSGMRAIFHA